MELPTGTVLLDPNFGTTVVNATEVSNEDIYRALSDDGNRALMRTFEEWAQNTSGGLRAYAEGGQSGSVDRRAGNLWHRDRYVMPGTFVDQMRLARTACLDDDIVAGVAETTESLAFSSMSFFAEDREEQDVYNQVARKLDLDSRLREIWRELFCVSQVYVAVSRGRQSFKVRGTTKEGNQRRKVIDLIAPKRITLLDPCKVVPVGSPYGSAFTGVEMFAYCAELTEGQRFGSITNGELRDEVVEELVTGRYTPDRDEAAELDGLGYNTSSMWLLDPTKVFRHTLTVPGFRRVAEVRLKAIFELLDMKHQLRQMERAHLIGGTNFIVLVTKGTDQHPALPQEVVNLQAQVRTVARVPILVGDHRLKVEIVTPKLDNTLRAERWNTIDSRITARCYGMFMLGNYCCSMDTEILTAEGWKQAEALTVGEEVLTLDPARGVSGWEPLQAVNVFDHHGPMLAMEGRFHSSLTTPNHRWWVDRRYGAGMKKSRWEWVTSETMDYHHRIPMAAPHGDHPVLAKYDDALVELVAWYWTEGRAKASSAGVDIAQSKAVNGPYVERIRMCLEKTFGPGAYAKDGGCWHETESTDGRMALFEINAEPGRVLRELAPGRHKIPTGQFLRSLTRAQIEMFVETVIDGDGWRDGSTRFTQVSEEAMGTFAMACALAGKATGRRTDNQIGCGKVTVLNNTTTSPIATAYYNPGAAARADWVPYEGQVWCPTTPSGTWLARRNGTVFWTGNSAGASGDDSVKLVKVVARGMESRRHMIVRSLEKQIFDPLFEGNEVLKSRPKIQFHPRSIALDFDAAFASFLFDLRQAKEISRETILNQFDLDQDLEAELRQRESEEYDEIFQTQVPFSTPSQGAPGPADPAQKQDPAALPRDNGGGRRSGGGAAPGSGQGQDPRRRAKRAAVKKAAAGAAQKLTITIEGADDLSSEDLAAALRAALKPGEDHAHAPDEA